MNPDFIKKMDSKIDQISSFPVINGYYLVIGGGKIGTRFVEHARKSRLPFVLVIDIDCEALVSGNVTVLKDRWHLVDVLDSLTASGKSDDCYVSCKGPSIHGCNIFFYCMDSKEIPYLLNHGMPEYIIPAVPTHAAVDIVEDLLNFQNERAFIRKVCIDEDDEDSMQLFKNIVSFFPDNIVAGKFPEHGTIFLSYARPGEICPGNCKGQEGYCYTFTRIKPITITSYVLELSGSEAGWVFESCQMAPGIGGIRGRDLRENLIAIMKHIRRIKGEPSIHGTGERSFFIATTCNCHGILNILQIV
ncbi:hypothetical protein [Methanolobus halotolerans]|uniref:Uncharacterized protein n=1 Tax=Methanolobus halotolerans TaxID=2052935 RepID=A0A4E0Q093_9EURY|nr:hypothetical protein [Methanolobus halotolerans]TGC11437.1 hypothetical protein CUN85_00740 [Methanolobus halotolerans]